MGRVRGLNRAMRESKEGRRRRTLVIIAKLKEHYPDATCALIHRNPLELLVATILSAQCTDERVNIVTRELFKKYRTAKDYANADLQDLERIIKSTGFFRAKAKNLKMLGQMLISEHGGKVPQTLEELCRLPGVGRKTANVVLGNAFGKACGVVVDTHVKRLSYRLGLTNAITPEKVEENLIQLVPRQDWIILPHLLIFHGRRICKARRPACERCFLQDDCPKRGVKR